MAEENVFFLPIKQFCRRDVVTCGPDDDLVGAAEIMREQNISSLVVCEDRTPVGIFTDRDLRNKVVSRSIDPGTLKVREIMNTPLITISEDDFLYEALYLMSRHNIHRTGVVNGDGLLTGILTESDIIRLQSRTPQQMIRAIEEAESVHALRELHAKVQSLTVHLVGSGVAVPDLVRMIAHLNDRILLRLIALLTAERFADLPKGFAFVVLGSEGRQEQTLTTDQDNAIIYSDDLSVVEIEKIKAFAEALIVDLLAIGVPPCPGGIMAKNDNWRRSLLGWHKEIDRWMANAVPENILNGSMFFDLRTLYGDPSLEQSLKKHISDHLRHNSAFLAWTAANVLSFKVPLGLFGRIKVEKKGEHRGALDIKKAGIFAITEGAKVLALEAGVWQSGTRERLQTLVDKGVIDQQKGESLEATFDFLVYYRLYSQVAEIRAGLEPNNYVLLNELNRMEIVRMRLALEEVRSFQESLSLHFNLSHLR
jgi:CBS domain-containing protein